jgi:hypothetical protein
MSAQGTGRTLRAHNRALPLSKIQLVCNVTWHYVADKKERMGQGMRYKTILCWI